jgi:hypothetical protein
MSPRNFAKYYRSHRSLRVTEMGSSFFVADVPVGREYLSGVPCPWGPQWRRVTMGLAKCSRTSRPHATIFLGRCGIGRYRPEPGAQIDGTAYCSKPTSSVPLGARARWYPLTGARRCPQLLTIG